MQLAICLTLGCTRSGRTRCHSDRGFRPQHAKAHAARGPCTRLRTYPSGDTWLQIINMTLNKTRNILNHSSFTCLYNVNDNVTIANLKSLIVDVSNAIQIKVISQNEKKFRRVCACK